MPVVPFSPAGPAPLPQPDEPFMDMAAAMMQHERIQKVADREIARYPKGTLDADLVGRDEFGKEVLKNARRSENIEDERGDDVIMKHNEMLKPLELMKAPTS